MSVLTTPSFSVLVPTNHRARLSVGRSLWLAVDGRVRTWGLLQQMRPLTAVGVRPTELAHERVEGGVAAAAFFSASAILLFSRGWVTLDHLTDMTTMGAVGHDVAAALWTFLAGAMAKTEGDVKLLTAASPSASDPFATTQYSHRVCSGSKHHHVGSSSSRSDLLISSVRRRNCPGNRPTAQPSPHWRRGSRQSPGGNRSPKHSWFYQTATGTASPLSINPSQTERRWPK